MSKIFIKILSIILIVVGKLHGDELNCNFLQHVEGYCCDTDDSFGENEEITAIIGNHTARRQNIDVNVFFIVDFSETFYVPLKVCTFFENIDEFNIFGKKIRELKKKIFENCGKLKEIAIKFIEMKNLDEDLISDVKTLESFILRMTKVESLPKNFFSNNSALKNLDLSYNKFKTIKAEFPPNVMSIKLDMNDCVDAYYLHSDDGDQIYQTFLENVYKECGNYGNSSTNNSTIIIHENSTEFDSTKFTLMEISMNSLEQKVSEFKKELINFVASTKNNVETSFNSLVISINKTENNLQNLTKIIAANNIDKILSKQIKNITKITKNLEDNFQKLKSKIDSIAVTVGDVILNTTSEIDDSKNLSEIVKRLNATNVYLQSDLNRKSILIILLFVLQLIFIAFIVFVIVYVKLNSIGVNFVQFDNNDQL